MKQSLAQGGRAALGDFTGLWIKIAGLEGRSVNACKTYESFFIGETGNIAYFGNKLRAENRTNTI